MAATVNNPVAELRPPATDRILVVDDDSAMRRSLKRLFETEGYNVDLAVNGTRGLEMFRITMPSALVLDPRLPGVSGDDLFREVTRVAPYLPIIILGPPADVVDKVVLLELGADDYVTKPFSERELLARLRAVMRRSARLTADNFYAFGDVMVSFSKMEVTRCGEKVSLTAKEFKTLEFMIKNAERVISRDELLNEVWGYQNYPCTRTVDNHILRLRQKLENDPSDPTYLLTIHSVGYKFSMRNGCDQLEQRGRLPASFVAAG